MFPLLRAGRGAAIQGQEKSGEDKTAYESGKFRPRSLQKRKSEVRIGNFERYISSVDISAPYQACDGLFSKG